jgi:outer membrane protein assembly factor BamB
MTCVRIYSVTARFQGIGWRALFLGGLLLGGLAGRAETPQLAATNLWFFDFTGRLPYNSSCSAPAIADDGTLYLATFNGTLYAVTPDGRAKWRFQAGHEIISAPAIGDDGTVYFGSRDRTFYAVTPAGKLKWKFATGAWVDASPAIAADGTLYFGGWDKTFYALHPDGTVKWKFATGAILDSSPAIAADGTVYFGAHDRNLYALNPDGTVRWKFLTGGEIISSPALGVAGTIYFSSLDGNLYAVNPDGREAWRYHTGSTTKSSPVLAADGNICLGLNDQTLVVSREGQKLWHSGSPVPVEVSAVAVPGRFYYSIPWRTVRAVAFPDQWLWRADLNANVSAALVMDRAGILYACAGGWLYALQPPGEALPPANSPWPMFRANARHTGRVGK